TVLHYLSTTSDLQAFILSNIYNNTMDNITAVNNDGQNAFHHCIAHGKQKRAIAFLEVMETLSNNASPIPLLSNYDKFNKSPLLTALQHNYEMVARKIIAILGDDIQLQLEDNEIGENALGISLKKFPELGVSLIQKGATLWFEDLLIIVDFKKPHNFKRMYEAGFDFNQNFHPNDLEGNNNESEVPEAFSEDPFNILFVAILYNPKNIHHIVHQGSADVNCTTAENGLSALQFACIHGQREAVKKLIKCEADINYKENLDYSALTFALENIPTHDHYQYNNYVKIIKLLLRKGATITLNDLTINHSNVEITSLLQENYKKQTH
ncbi:MAG: ankyrin repeat domain-containing protein, partial [Methanobacterium sp.]